MINQKYPQYDLPLGNLVKGIIVPLKFNYLPWSGCACGGKIPRNWHHKFCGCQSYINQYGDLFCKNYNDRPECSGYFILDAQFQCDAGERSETWYESRKRESSCLVAVAQAMQATEFTLEDDDIIAFGTSLTAEIPKRWYK